MNTVLVLFAVAVTSQVRVICLFIRKTNADLKINNIRHPHTILHKQKILISLNSILQHPTTISIIKNSFKWPHAFVYIFFLCREYANIVVISILTLACRVHFKIHQVVF